MVNEHLHKVVIDHPGLKIVDNLNDKLIELRAKRDACALHHEELKYHNDKYNKIIIVLSLLCAFVETLKMQLGLTNLDSWIGDIASLMPIFLSTVVSIISSLLKFKKFPEKMEALVQVSDKANFAIEKIRKLQEYIHFRENSVVFEMYQKEVADSYREALMSIEVAIYPDKRAKYYKTAQENFIKIKKDEKNYMDEINKIGGVSNGQRIQWDPAFSNEISSTEVEPRLEISSTKQLYMANVDLGSSVTVTKPPLKNSVKLQEITQASSAPLEDNSDFD